mgnify:CR=1 FL=1|tara:strand:- start:1206 stop:1424 length:219 start_codon:yes stop_codon:yes gene_type:complete
MDKRFVVIVTRITSRIKTLAGSVEHINPIIVTRCRSGGAVERKEKIHPVVSSQSMIVKMTKTPMISKRKRNR